MNYDRLAVKRGESAALGLWGGDKSGGGGGEVSLGPQTKDVVEHTFENTRVMD